MGIDTDIREVPAEFQAHNENEPLTSTAVLPAWFDNYRWANGTFPQMDFGIKVATGTAVLGSLLKREVDWPYFLRSGFTDAQTQTLKEDVIRYHDLFRIPILPTNAGIRRLWPIAGDSLSYQLLDYATEGNAPEPSSWEHPEEDDKIIQAYLEDGANSGELHKLYDIYAVGEATLRSPEILSIAQRRLAGLNPARKEPLPKAPYKRGFHERDYIIRDMVEDRMFERAVALGVHRAGSIVSNSSFYN